MFFKSTLINKNNLTCMIQINCEQSRNEKVARRRDELTGFNFDYVSDSFTRIVLCCNKLVEVREIVCHPGVTSL